MKVKIYGNYMEYEYDMWDTYKYVVEMCKGMHRSLRLVEKDTEHLLVRCPVSGEYLNIKGTEYELEWLHEKLKTDEWYRL